MKTHLAMVIVAASMAFTAVGQEWSCKSSESTNEARILFSPTPLAGSSTVWVFNRKGQWLKEEHLVAPQGRRSEFTFVSPQAFYPENTFIATAESTRCVSGRGTKKTPFESCQGWFKVNLMEKPKPPMTLSVEAQPSTDVTVALARSRGFGSHCTRTYAGRNQEVVVFDGEEVSLEVRTDRTPTRFTNCGAAIARPDKQGIVSLSARGESWPRGGTTENAMLAMAPTCKAVTVRVRR